MKKLLVTTVLSFSLLGANITNAAETNKEPSAYEEGMGHGKAISALPKEKADLFKTSMKDVYKKNKDIYKQIKGLRSELNIIVKSDTFDEKSYIAKSTEIANLQNKIRENRTEEFAKFLSKLTPDERSKFADNLKNMRQHHKGHNFKKNGNEETNKQ